MSYAVVYNQHSLGCACRAGLSGYGGLGGLGGFGALTGPVKTLWDQANAMARNAMGAPGRAAIDASGLSASIKRKAKQEPLSMPVLAAEAFHDLALDYIRKVRGSLPRDKRPAQYKLLNGQAFRIDTRGARADNPFYVAQMMLVVTNHHPLEATKVALSMGFDISKSTIDMAAAAGEALLKQAGETAQAAAKAVDDVVQSTTRMVTSWFSGFGDGGVTAGAGAAGSGAAAGGTATIFGMTFLEAIAAGTGLATALSGLVAAGTPAALAIAGAMKDDAKTTSGGGKTGGTKTGGTKTGGQAPVVAAPAEGLPMGPILLGVGGLAALLLLKK